MLTVMLYQYHTYCSSDLLSYYTQCLRLLILTLRIDTHLLLNRLAIDEAIDQRLLGGYPLSVILTSWHLKGKCKRHSLDGSLSYLSEILHSASYSSVHSRENDKLQQYAQTTHIIHETRFHRFSNKRPTVT